MTSILLRQILQLIEHRERERIQRAIERRVSLTVLPLPAKEA